MDDTQDSPIIVSQPRVLMLVAVMLGVFIILLGVYAHQQQARISFIPGEWLLVPMGAAALVAGLIGMARPGRLTLSAAGVEYRLLLSTRRLPWTAVNAAGLYTYGIFEGVCIHHLRGAQPLLLAGVWPVGPEDLVDLIQQGQARWTRA